MHITRYTDYSIRILIYLAVNNEGVSSVNDIAKSYDISKDHLMKIVQDLNARGYLTSIRGKYGGIKLNKKPSEINVGRLVRNSKKETNFVECFKVNNQCVITKNCQLKHIFSKALESFFSTLDEYTLNDLVGDKNSLKLLELLSQNVSK